MDWDHEYDLVVVGTGGGALTAALTASWKGLKTLVVEKTSTWGGTTAYSGGGVWIPANPLMIQDGVDDSLDDALRYLEDIVGDVGPASAAERRRALLQGGPEMIAFLSRLGVRWQRVVRYPDYYPERPGGSSGRQLEPAIIDGRRLGPWLDTLRRPAQQPPFVVQVDDVGDLVTSFRTLRGFSRGLRVVARSAAWKVSKGVPLTSGASLVGQLMEACQRRGVTVWLDTPFEELVAKGSEVTGAVVRHDGRKLRVKANAGVVLGAGGFSRNSEFRQRYQPVTGEYSGTGEGDTGDAIQAGMAVGAATALMDDAWWVAAFQYPGGGVTSCLWERSLPGAIVVDEAGQRFVNESIPYTDFGHAQLEHNAVPAWLIMDARHRQRYIFRTIYGILPPRVTPKPLKDGFFLQAPSIRELAEKAGIDADGLAATVTRFNGFAASGVDADFGRGKSAYDNFYGDPRVKPNPNLAPIENAPFWAARLWPGDIGTKGGLLTDEHGRVVDESGDPIDGLYAVGNTTASVMGRTYAGPGATIGPAMIFAYHTAKHAAGRQAKDRVHA